MVTPNIPANPSPDRQLAAFRDTFTALRQEIGKLIVGQSEAIDAALYRAGRRRAPVDRGAAGAGQDGFGPRLGRRGGPSFQRIQFTPDLMPADLLGTYVVMETPQGRRTFEFQKGRSSPIWCWPIKSTAARPRPGRRCWRRWRARKSPSPARVSSCRSRSWSWPPRTRSKWKAPFRCRSPNSIGSS